MFPKGDIPVKVASGPDTRIIVGDCVTYWETRDA